MQENSFWNSAWTSERLTKSTEMLDRFIPRAAVEYSYKLLGNIKKGKLLEIGCGSGIQTIEFCKMGADVTAIDISENSIRSTKEICKNNNIKNTKIIKMNAENMKFKDSSFDRVYINRVLMHANKEKVINECLRVLKKDGVLVINEVLKHWIFAFPYRTFSPYKKSKPDYLTIKDIKKYNAHHKEFYLFSTFFLFLFYLIKNKNLAYSIFNIFAKIDSILLNKLPPLRYISWVTVANIRK